MTYGQTDRISTCRLYPSTIGNKYGGARSVRNTAINYDNIGATKSTIMSVAKKPVNIYSGLNGIPRAEQFSP